MGKLEEDEGLDQLDGQLHGVNASLLVQVSITLRCKIDNSNSITGQHYFKVQQTNQPANPPTDTTERLLQLVHQQLDQKQKVIEEKKQVIKDSDNLTEVSSWLERTQWIRHLAGQNRVAMAQLVNRPRDEELGLQYVEKSLDRLVEKSRQTIIQVKLVFLLNNIW